ncbi:MAG: response regulator [Bacteroidales bacterium]|nr:response regulator [Bacteroidales bacterium]
MQRILLLSITVLLLISRWNAFGINTQEEYLFTRITADQGLSHNQVTCIFKDSRGFMWFGTNYGLNSYDGYSFKIFKHRPSDPYSLPDNRISDIFEGPDGKIWVSHLGGYILYDPTLQKFVDDSPVFYKEVKIPRDDISRISCDSRGNLWFLTNQSGIFVYQKRDNSIIHFETEMLTPGLVSDVQIDSKGFAWMIDEYGEILKVDIDRLEVVYRNDEIKGSADQRKMFRIYIDKQDMLWISSISSDEGAYLFNPENEQYIHFKQGSREYPLSSNIASRIIQDDNGRIWIATDHGGINIVDKRDFSVKVLRHSENDERSISQNSITALYKDNEGVIWAGTYKRGICFYHQNLFKFRLFRHHAGDASSLPFDDVNCFQEDSEGNLWIGTNGAGLIHYNREENTFRTFLHNPDDPNSLSNNVIVSLLNDSRGQLWIGTFYGGLDRFDGKRFYHYKHDSSRPGSLSDDDVWHLTEDVFGNIWIGTLGSGIDKYDPKTGSFQHFRADDSRSFPSDYILHITGDGKGNLWIGTPDGLAYFDHKLGTFRQFINQTDNTKSLSNNVVPYICIDSRGLVWVATQEGLNVLVSSEGNGTFSRYYMKDGLPDHTIQSVLEDDNGDIWVSTTNGLSRIRVLNYVSPQSFKLQFSNFNETDGLQGKEYNEGVALKTREGELIFGGPDGFNIFHPSALKTNENPPRVVITDVQILNKSVGVGEKRNGRIILNKSLSETKGIVLKPSEDILSIEFSALNYIHPEKNQYEYKLEGFNKTWIRASADDRKATYTNLDPGEYIFRVRASNNDGVWNETGTSLKIVAEPSFWRTRTAIVIYIALLVAALFLLRFFILQRERKKFRIEQAQLEAQRRHEMDLLKIRFFTNVSHEFRTPLSLIISPLERILKNPGKDDHLSHLKLIYRNARRLLNLVNQLLDFRRMEVQKIDLKPAYGDIINFIDEIYSSFSDLAEKKSIDFQYESSHASFFTYFDHDKLEKILFNLLSNAFKFTPEGKSINIAVRLLDNEEKILTEETSKNSDNVICIQVSDTGLGVPKENLEKIFDRFFQANDSGNVVSQGSGIGLSLTKDFVELHKGTIKVESELHEGTSFTVRLPLLVKAPQSDIPQESPKTQILPDISDEDPDTDEILQEARNATILLVEDNDDFRFYLKDNLKADYEIFEASNGREGLEKVRLHFPDLVVSDVMMPEMDGFELCRTLKSDPNTSHIPVILLTARMSEQKKMEGFETGADDYVTKPFSFELLASRISNLITQRNRMKDSFQKHFKIEPGEINITSLDEKLMNKALKLVEENMSNSEFTVERLSRELGMSRVHLYKKLTTLTGKTPIEFIRIMRLKRAAQLLEKSQMTVAEVAYEVGFNDPRYFSKYFKAEFGMLPSQYITTRKNLS